MKISVIVTSTCLAVASAPAALAAPGAGAERAVTSAPRRKSPGAGAERAVTSAPRRKSPGAGKPRVAVLILQTGVASSELADNLTEVLLVNLSTRGKFRVIGKEVVKTQLGGVEKRVLECVGNRTCVGNVATTLGLDYLIVGTLGKLESTWMYNLYFIDAASGGERKRVHKRVTGDIPALTKSMDKALAELLKPRIKPGGLRILANVKGAQVHVDDQFAGTVPLKRAGIKPGQVRIRVELDGYYAAEKTVKVAAGTVLTVRFVLVRIPPRRPTWKLYMAWTTLGLAAVAGAAGVATGVLSKRSVGTTQRALVEDIDRRKKLALVANVMFGVAGAAALTSAALFIFAHNSFYVGGRERAAHLEVSPALGGAYVSGGFRW